MAVDVQGSLAVAGILSHRSVRSSQYRDGSTNVTIGLPQVAGALDEEVIETEGLAG